MDKYYGIDIGSSTIKVCEYDFEKNKIIYERCESHYGNIPDKLLSIVSKLDKNSYIRFTGENSLNYFSDNYVLEDIPAIEKGMKILFPNVGSIIEIGSEHARYITNLGHDKIPQFSVNESCAGGTGSFFITQTNRLGIDIEDYSKILESSSKEIRMSGKCAVFAKTDIIHKQQEGVSVPDILLGLCYATIRNFKTTVIKKLPINKPIAVSGGVIRNSGVIKAVKDVFKLKDDELLINESSLYAGCIGCLATANKSNSLPIDEIISILSNHIKEKEELDNIPRLNKLKLLTKTELKDPKTKELDLNEYYYLGIDVGSTSTNLVLIGEDNEIYDYLYLRTKGEPKKVVQKGIEHFKKKYEGKLKIKASGVTGSGRYLISKMIGATNTIDEITSQARCATYFAKDIDTVFEIGGQDSKYISLKDGKVVDFAMNRICAAGTGSFIEEQAQELNVEINEYGKLALNAEKPVNLGDRCTVFVKSSIENYLAKGAKIDDILAGLCHSVVLNYLNKVVENRHVGKKICLQGGICYNPATVAAFEQRYGTKIIVNPYFSISGAYGVALLTKEQLNVSKKEEHDKKSKPSKDNKKDEFDTKLDPDKKNIIIPMCLHNTHMYKPWKKAFESFGFNVILVKTNQKIVEFAKDNSLNDVCFPMKLALGHFINIKTNYEKADFVFLPTLIEQKEKEISACKHNFGCLYMQNMPQIIYDESHLEEIGIKFLNPLFYFNDDKFMIMKEAQKVFKQLGLNKEEAKEGAMLYQKFKKMQGEKKSEKKQKIQNKIKNGKNKTIALICRPYDANDEFLNMGVKKEFKKRGYDVIMQSFVINGEEASYQYENLYWPFGKHIIDAARSVAKTPNLYACYLTNHGCGPDSMILHLFEKEMGDKKYLHLEVDEHVSKVGVITRIEAFINSIESNENETYVSKSHPNIKTLNSINELETNELPTYVERYDLYTDIFLAINNAKNFKSLPNPSRSTVELGSQETLSKEYLSYVNEIGSVKKALLDNDNQEINCLLTENQGTELPGFYANITGCILRNKPVNINVIKINDLIKDENVIKTLLIGDLMINLGLELKEDVQTQFEYLSKLSIEEIFDYFSKFEKKVDNSNNKSVFIIGEPHVVYNEYLNDNLIKHLRSENLDVKVMPFLEYCIFLAVENNVNIEDIALLNEIIKFDKNKHFPNLSNLSFPSKNNLNLISGGNLAYLNRLLMDETEEDAIIYASSLYENTSVVLSLLSKNNTVPTLYLGYEGSNKDELREKLASFIYYLK